MAATLGTADTVTVEVTTDENVDVLPQLYEITAPITGLQPVTVPPELTGAPETEVDDHVPPL